MINFSSGIRHLYLTGINDVSNDIRFGINEWLQEGKDYIIDGNLPNNQFNIQVYDTLDFLKPYAYDINRLSCAAIESLNDIQKHPHSPKFNGWAITKYYYSAFFSAHSILRLSGYGIFNIEPDSFSKIRQLATSYGYSYGNLNTGLYCQQVNGVNINFSKDPRYDDSHKGLWLRFLHFITDIQAGIYSQLPQGDAQLIVDKLNQLKDALTAWGSNTGHWLSRIRNLNNYSQDFGIWFPYKTYHKDFDNILKYKQLCKENPLNIDLVAFKGKDLLYFVRTCQLINAINFDIQKDLLTRHPFNKSFLLHGIFEYNRKYIKPDQLIKV
jgi:hypothetical protein